MRKYRFLQYDVFTSVPFGGNQLAVFPEAGGLSADEMQAIAREMNYSETTFVLPASDTKALLRVRRRRHHSSGRTVACLPAARRRHTASGSALRGRTRVLRLDASAGARLP